MSSKRPPEESFDQGELFRVEVHPSGLTDPGGPHKPHAEITEVYPEGAFPEVPSDPEVVTPQTIAVTAAAEAVKTRNRRHGNLGKHSAFTEGEGSYVAGMQLGMFLPGFGPVKERNWEEAKAHARKLDEERRVKAGLQPSFLDQLAEEVAKQKQTREQPPRFESHDKLIALRDDDRAGFLPTTHREKSQAAELLDYMDTAKFPGGVNDRLTEIFYKQQRVARESGSKGRDIQAAAEQSVASVINEWADYLENATQTGLELRALSDLLNSGLNPSLKLVELKAEDPEIVAKLHALVRYINLGELRSGEGQPLVKDPLKTRENRTIGDATRNKRVEDQYTGVEVSDAALDEIDMIAATMNVRGARILVKGALKDQENRWKFWNTALRGVNQDGFREVAQQALARAKGATTVS